MKWLMIVKPIKNKKLSLTIEPYTNNWDKTHFFMSRILNHDCEVWYSNSMKKSV